MYQQKVKRNEKIVIYLLALCIDFSYGKLHYLQRFRQYSDMS
nr:MAG TPA: hypothetical protein [Caudoviricetes sp.]